MLPGAVLSLEQQAAAASLKQEPLVKQEPDMGPGMSVGAHVKQEPDVKQEAGAESAWQQEQARSGVKQEPEAGGAVKSEAAEDAQRQDAALAGLGSYGSDSDDP